MRQEPHLAPRAANHQPLSPIDFLDWAVTGFADRTAVVWRDRQWTYGEFGAMVRRFAAFLEQRDIGPGDVVSLMCVNRPEMLAAHYAVPLVGAVLNSINTRLDAPTVSYILDHSESRLLIYDPTCGPVAETAARDTGITAFRLPEDVRGGTQDSLDLLDGEEPAGFAFQARISDEWQPICLNYTSGTTGKPKGVVYHHRGAYLNALGNVLALGLNARSSYLWVLPMFHCNGWCHTWAVTAAGGVHVCLDRVDPSAILALIAEREISHMACAPVVLYMLLNHADAARRDPSRRVLVATGGASPTSSLISEMDALGFELVHLYGLTESFGPVTMRQLDSDELEMQLEERAAILARQGKRHRTANRVRVIGEDGEDVRHDGQTVGEIRLRGNTLMQGYYRDPEATDQAFQEGMFRTGDLAVVHPGGDIEIRDRSKDVIISGGENISSLEVESILHRHPAVLLAAVVAAPDPKWGEIPVAFVEIRTGAHEIGADELIAFCRQHMAGFKIPRRVHFQELPRTATGKIQKFLLRDIATQLL